MTFLSPTILFGLLAVSIPLIIHLLSLRKTKEIEFSSIRFIEELKHESIRRLQLKHWILVLLRMLLIAALVLMFARPVGKGFISGAMTGEQETRVAILIDNSVSMSAEVESIPLLERVRKEVPGILNQYAGQTTVDIWKTCPPARVYSGPANEQAIRELIGDIPMTFSKDHIWSALDTMMADLDVREPNRECFIFSDFQTTPQKPIYLSMADSSDTPWRFYLVDQPDINHNISIRTGRVVSQVRLPDHIMKVKTHIENDGKMTMDYFPVELYLGSQRVGQVVSSLTAGFGKDFGFEAFPGKTGIIHGKITVPNDDFTPDNSLTFELSIADQIACTIIGQKTEDIYLLETALASIDKQSDFLLVNSRTAPVIDRIPLDETDVLILVNPQKITDEAILQIQSFINDGGGVIWFMGDGFETDKTSMQYAGLKLPVPREMVILPGENFIPVVAPDRNHPMLDGLNVRNFETELPQVFRYVQVETSSQHNPILSLSNGDPFLASMQQGNGQLVVCTSLLDLKWNDLPMRGFMVPLLHRILLVLATDESNSMPIEVDATKAIALDRDLIHSEWSVVMPSGRTVLYIPDFNSEMLLVDQTHELGSYTVLADGLPYTAFSTHLSPGEYPSTRVPEDIILNYFDVGQVRWIDPDIKLTGVLQDIRLGKSMWRMFLMIAIGLFILETIIGRSVTKEK